MKYRNDLKRRVLAGLFAGAALCLAAPAALAANSPVANNQLPAGGHVVAGDATVPDILKPGGNPNGATSATITQNSQNAVIVWDNGFNVGANATVNFEGPQGGYSTLNYDKGGSMSQIYGTINANNNGNIYIVNPAGVEIGNSAQINVGSLYVSNKKLDNELENIENKDNPNIGTIMSHGTIGDAVLMSLGNINANTVTFEGNRIVIDTERLKTGDGKMTEENIIVHTTDKNNVVIGYDAYNEGDNKGTYEGKQVAASSLATIDEKGQEVTNLNAYMWVEDVEQLQAIDTNLGGNYALRNSIDATATQEWNNGEGFKPIGIDSTGKVIVENRKYGFHGNFDGLSYNIFNLNINRTGAVNVGLFGVLHEAEINNVTFVGGAITGGNVVGSLAGAVLGNTHVNNVMNSASVTGGADVGGIIGYSGDEINQEEDSDKPITVGNADAHFSNMVNTGTVVSSGTSDGNGGTISDAGGLIGNLYQGTLDGTSYNLGSVTGEGHNVGGLVGHAYASKLGDDTSLIYNRLNVSGAYNVGGIVGSMTGTTVQNAENSGNVTATGHTMEDYKYHSAHWKGNQNNADQVITQEDIYIANAGGIAGTASGESNISNVQNSGDVSSSTAKKTTDKDVEYTYYTAGNVGGIVGRAENTNISNATNTENDVRGAHNVGGIAGYFGGKGIIKTGINNGGDILATGAVDENTAKEENITNDSHNNGFVTEWVRNGSEGGEKAIIGNMGGIVGYMDGDNVYITSSANRGTVHSQDIGTEVLPVSQAANAGGIVGKIDRSETKDKNDVIANYATAAVSNSYNTGDVRGYMGVGGVAGMMYNGEIAGSYNLGTVNTTRNKESFTIGDYYAVNMGGVVGDTTEQTEARALLYDVYNKGQIGDETFTYYARHVGGVVGRLSGSVGKAYNTGAIYNGYSIVGGIVGWLNAGSVTNSFNTGNITVLNHDNTEESNVGGIAGDVNIATGNIELTNVYNLGTLRSIRYTAEEGSDDKNGNDSVLGGIVGAIHRYNDNKNGKLLISNAYTTGNLYSDGRIQSIVTDGSSDNYKLTNTYYIHPADTGSFDDLVNANKDNSNKDIAFADKDQADSYAYEDSEGSQHSLTFTTQGKGSGKVDEGNETTIKADDTNWRIYDGSTPILNAFLPNTEKYFSGETGVTNAMDGIASIQYGTAYDPLLTIIDAGKNTQNLTFDWQKLGVNNAAGIAVYGAGLTLDNFKATGGSGYFGGMIYSDGALSIASESGGNVALGSASQLYGSSVTISADGNVTIYGDVTATGNKQDGTTRSEGKYSSKDYLETDGSISITGGSVDVYGQLTSAKEGKTTFVPGIGSMAAVGSWNPGDVNDQTKPMTDIGDRFGYTTGASTATGSISITANETASEDGHVNVYYGHQQKGFLDTAGSLSVTAAGDIYMDSDLSIGGDLTLNAGQVKDSEGNPVTVDGLQEAVLDISNIGKVQAANGMLENALTGLHAFLNHFAKNGTDGGEITLGGEETKLAVDMWGDGAFDLTKYDLPGEVGATLADKLDQLYINGGTEKGKHYTYIWVSTGEQLKGIQQYKKNNSNSNILSYNFALKNDIDASDVTDYEAIGAGAENGYTGTFDGRDNRIIGLDTTKRTDGKTLTNVGIFDTIGKNADGTEQVGTVEDLRVYSGTFHGTNNAGAVAGVNKGNISNVTAFGNVVDVQNTANEVSYAGGIVGANEGSITGASAVGTATQSSIVTAGSREAAAGGIAGLNTNNGTISTSTSNSAVNASEGNAAALGGVVGVNAGELNNVDSLGVTTGIYQVGEHNPDVGTQYSDNVGGIAGINQAGGTVESAYNESIVSGRDNVGGILGVNKGTSVSNVANASSITGEAGANDISEHVGGLVGANEGSITNGRNNGEITGNNYVGGLVGNNGEKSTLTNLTNDSAAAITGDSYVGGIAGSNAGTISAENQTNLINRGSITGQMYVGGVAGENIGTIEYVKSDINLNVRYKGELAKYFGGVAGINGKVEGDGETIINTGTITNATNTADIIAPDADFVGGIVGWNTSAGTLKGMGNSNEGRVEGASHVGGVAGLNEAEIDGSRTEEGTVGIFNSGVVIAHKGGAGGIFGENTGAISHAELTNNGIVSGTYSDKEGENGTGGIFGVNSGSVTYSSLKNEINGQVMGTQNVGGLIGMNTGDITGGRTDKTEDGQNVDNGYYKYQIYNNGTIQAGTWNDDDKDGIVDEGELDPAKTNSQNIAGLFGINSGKVTAGYNTGAINAGSSSNVGGIAGTNEGTLDQVFNTVITGVNEDGANVYGSITGHTNVGGIAGTNSDTGTISNAYNTTGVTGNAEDAVTGFIAGTNSNTAGDSISNVYSTIDDKLVNSDNLVGSDNKATHVYDSGNGFGEGGSSIHKDGEEAAENDLWRQYGDKNPILKVFLTQLTVNETGNDKADEKTLDEYLNLVYNGKEQDINIQDLIDKGFITGPEGMTEEELLKAYNNTLKKEPNPNHDSEVLYNTSGQVHANEGKDAYSWLASSQIAGGKEGDVFTPNNLGYDIQMNSTPTLHKAQISIALDDVNRTYGNQAFTNGTNYGYQYTIVNGNKELNDTMSEELAGGITFRQTKDEAVDGFTGDKQTNNANKENENYTWQADFGFADDTLSEDYTFVTGNNQTGNTVTVSGNSHVDRANIEISANPKQVYVGTKPQFSGTVISDVLVNGDTIFDGSYQYGTEQLPADTSKPGEFDIGIHFGSTYLDGDSDASAWDGVLNSLFKNYNVTFKPGTLTVVEWPADVVEPPVDEHWNFLFHDNPWDRNRDFRERKAEVHFVAGGMTL